MLEEYNYNEVKKEDGRVETLVQAIDRIEVLEKQLNIAVSKLKEYADHDNWSGPDDCVQDIFFPVATEGGWEKAEEALEEIKELNK